jgi:hypothetical protein
LEPSGTVFIISGRITKKKRQVWDVSCILKKYHAFECQVEIMFYFIISVTVMLLPCRHLRWEQHCLV